MTFDDDFIAVAFDGGTRHFFLKANKIEWPPPIFLNAFGFKLERVRFSAITDEQRAGMTHVRRGAEYKVCEEQS